MKKNSANAIAIVVGLFYACATLSWTQEEPDLDVDVVEEADDEQSDHEAFKVRPNEVRVQSASDDGNITLTSNRLDRGLGTPITLDADDAYLPKILSILGEYSGYNVVAGPEVNNKQRISIHLRNTPVEEAVNLVVRAAGLSYEIVGNSFLVTAHENLKKEVGIGSYFVQLEYANAGEVKALLHDLTGSIQVDTARNALLIATSPKVISEVRRVIELVDKPSQQIMLQTRVIEVSIEKVRRLGVDWSKLSQLTTIIAENPYSPLTGPIKPVKNALGALPVEHEFQPINGLENVGNFSRQLTAFNITVDWLVKNNLGELLSDTKLTTMNNRTAQIHIGEIIPFLVQSQETAQVEREEIGIRVFITPQINNDGYITAHVRPEVSSIVELIDGRIPRKKIRTAETTVLVKDRQKIIIAGLLSTDETKEVHKIPFFGDLLFLGRFFQHEEITKKETDLIIEITPYILNNDPAEAQALEDSLFQMRKLLEEAEKPEKDTVEIGPTHLALLPTSEVLKPFQYTIGAHEIAMGQYGNLQLFFAPWQSIGRLRWGLKYAPAPSLALGIGYHDGMFTQEGKYNLGSRLGLFLVKHMVDTRFFDWYGNLDAQLGEYHSIGAGTGMALHFGGGAKLMVEAMTNYTPDTPEPDAEYWDPWGTLAVRMPWPWLRGLTMDLGVSYRHPATLREPYSEFREDYEYFIYADLAYSSWF